MKKSKSTSRDALTLAKATAIKSALQLLTPLVLVRLFDQSEFGEYKLFWLIAGTALLLRLGVDRSLLYFLPKSTEEERARFVSQTLVYFLGAGLLASFVLLGSNYWLPSTVGTLTEPGYMLALFVFLWFTSTPIQVLPNADRNVLWQARIIVALAVLRAGIVVTVAWFTRDIQSIFVALVVWAGLHWVILAIYVRSRYGLNLPLPTSAGISRQLKYAMPFGVSRLIAGVRVRGVQWIVTYEFSTASLAIFSIGQSFNIVLSLIRTSLSNVLLPKMSKSHAGGDTRRSLELNSRGNIAVVAFVAPTVAYIFVFAEHLIRLLYTQEYVSAVPVLRVYMVNLLVLSTELATVLMILEQGRHVAKVSAIVLVLGLLLSYAGAQILGLTGVAIGALLGAVLNRFLNFRHAAKLLNISLRQLQDWGTLGRIVLAAIIAASASGYLILANTNLGDFVTLCIAAPLFALAYAASLWALGLVWLVKAMADRGAWR
jgi:O-antigen/teichoic acid export membrane protein